MDKLVEYGQTRFLLVVIGYRRLDWTCLIIEYLATNFGWIYMCFCPCLCYCSSRWSMMVKLLASMELPMEDPVSNAYLLWQLRLSGRLVALQGWCCPAWGQHGQDHGEGHPHLGWHQDVYCWFCPKTHRCCWKETWVDSEHFAQIIELYDLCESASKKAENDRN